MKPFALRARSRHALLLALLLVASSIMPCSAGDKPKPGFWRGYARHARILPPQPRSSQRIYAEYQARWWQWAMSFPLDAHPLNDTLDNLAAGQSGPVWFLGGVLHDGAAVRRGTVPAGKALFFPVLNLSYGLTRDEDTEEAARELINTILNPANLVSIYAEIDGKRVNHLPKYFTEAALFVAGPLPANHLPLDLPEFDPPAGSFVEMVDVGVYLLVAPLSPGKHVIRFGGEVYSPEFDYGYTQEVTYHLTVKK
jgi:hypothetical protein